MGAKYSYMLNVNEKQKVKKIILRDDIGASGNIVLRLAAVIPKHKNHFLFFDNWFTSLKLLATLYKDGIYSLGTVRKDRIHGLTFSSDNIMKKKGRGTYEEYEATIEDVKLFALKWFDNKITAWIRYKADMQIAGLEKKDILDSLGFRAEVAEGLCLLGKSENTRKRGRPSRSIERNFEERKKRSQTKPIPQFDVRTDQIALMISNSSVCFVDKYKRYILFGGCCLDWKIVAKVTVVVLSVTVKFGVKGIVKVMTEVMVKVKVVVNVIFNTMFKVMVKVMSTS
ncbi:unnamed protein product [Acanthoscelides obtectus]|uniref:PiggyBac transposable element-derived protein domain-containing protein n=1 Tax=Acanthoscelides obtectus TaxID=200917 RepID=A0A9P0MHL0_ACAOB|nr:unnamed protein product [Acanthoscelides obtectus]CAK1679531.1 PiggyBac transposable element-derived protein 3 [Acanthoscelides obtectus]